MVPRSWRWEIHGRTRKGEGIHAAELDRSKAQVLEREQEVNWKKLKSFQVLGSHLQSYNQRGKNTADSVGF